VLLAFQINIYQWLVPLIAIFFIYRIFTQFRRGHRLVFSTIVWIGFWLTLSLLAIIPDLVSFSIAESLGFKDNVNAVIFVLLGFLFLMTYYLSSMLEKLEKQMTELVRKIALDTQKFHDERKELETEISELRENKVSTHQTKIQEVSE